MNYNILTYCIYLPIISLIMIKIGWLLYNNGKIFLVRLFNNKNSLVDQVNKLLLVGFYFVNIGYAIYTIAYWELVTNTVEIVYSLSNHLGIMILSLAILHYNNLFWLNYKSKLKL